jgi:hypothetical protein
MKRTRHKRTPSVRRRALEFIAAHPGCTEALLAAENIPADVLVELVQSGLVIARIERLDDEDGAVEVTCTLRRQENGCWQRGGKDAPKPANCGEPTACRQTCHLRPSNRCAQSLEISSVRPYLNQL